MRGEMLKRFFVFGASLGLAVGLCEAWLLHAIPRIPPLTRPDVSLPIWFLAPLSGLILGTLVGSVCGLIVGFVRLRSVWASFLLSAALFGVGCAFVGELLGSLHAGPEAFELFPGLPGSLAWFLGGSGGAIIAGRIFWTRTTKILDPENFWPMGILPTALAALAILLMLGAGLGSAWRIESARTTEAVSPAARPNIVLVTLDTVRADHLSVYGYSRPTSPNLERLAREGILFEKAIVPSSWTLTSHSSMLTGLLPHQHGASWSVPLTSAVRTLPEILQSLGYETAGFTSNLHYGQAGWGMAQGFHRYEDDSVSLRHNFRATLAGEHLAEPLYRRLLRIDRLDRRSAEELNRDIFRWFRRRSGRPFFLFVNYLDAHAPYWAPPPFNRRFGELTDAAVRRMDSMRGMRVPEPVPPENQASLIAGYDNCIAYLDEHLGRLIEFLRRSPDWPNTMVIVTADHGEAFGEHGTYGHEWNLHREIVHVPLLIWGPGIPKNARIAHLTRVREVFPTVLDLATSGGLPLAPVSLRRFWTPGYQPSRADDAVVSQLIPNAGESGTAYISLLTSGWHYLQDSRGQRELYLWPHDPEERVNQAESPEHQPVLRELREMLDRTVRHSLQPWRGPKYLDALNRPDSPFLHEVAFNPTLLPPPPYPIGMSQALFASDPASPPGRTLPPEHELIKSLPYR